MSETPAANRSLIDRLQDHTGAWDNSLDEEIARAIGWDQYPAGGWQAVGAAFPVGKPRRTAYAVELPAFTRSLDAAISLLPLSGFPLWTFRLEVRSLGARGMSYFAEVTAPSREAHGFSRSDAALAVCAAALRARAFSDKP